MAISKYVAATAGLGLIGSVTLGVAAVTYVLRSGSLIQTQLAAATAAKNPVYALTSEVFDRRGVKLGEFAGERRYFVALGDLPKPVVQAFISAEDKSFYSHHGINPAAAVRALLANLRGGRLKQGASTITQQLARLFYLDQSKTWERKVKEALLALALERRLSKDEILELYLNKIYLGNHSYGIEAAARNYFRKHAAQLNTAEAAVLAGLPKSPNAYAPHRHPEAASQRQQVVLQRLVEDGRLTAAEAARWAKQPLDVASGPEDFTRGAPYAVQAVRAELTRKFELKQLPERGLRIYTTIDAALQRAADQQLGATLKAMRKLAAQAGGRKLPAGAIDGALLSLEPSTGAILALQGGGDFSRSQFDRTAATKRPLGALFLPAYIGLALERGYTLASRIGDDPLGGQSDRRSGGPTLYDVLRNGAAAAGAPLYAALGQGSVQAYAERLGWHFARADLTLAYGTGEASPLQVAVAYTALTNGGRLLTPHLIERITLANAQGFYQDQDAASSVQAVPPQAAYIVREALQDAVAYGHASKARGVAASTAGMGSASDDLHDAWFVGCLSTVVSVLWSGADNGRVRLATNHTAAVDLLAASWASYMRSAPAVYIHDARFPPAPAGISFAKKPAYLPAGPRSLPFVSGSEPQRTEQRRF